MPIGTSTVSFDHRSIDHHFISNLNHENVAVEVEILEYAGTSYSVLGIGLWSYINQPKKKIIRQTDTEKKLTAYFLRLHSQIESSMRCPRIVELD